MGQHDHSHEHDHDHDHDHDEDGHGGPHARGHGHGHHHHDHGPPPGGYSARFAAGIALNLGFVIIEATYGYIAGSLALIADAGHNFSDVLSLGLAWGAASLASSKPSPRRTYGYRRTTILASLLSAGMLLLAMGGIAWEAIGGFSNPARLDGMTMIVVAGIGVIINTATALMFASGRHGDLNIRAAFLHMAADALLSLGVVIGGVAILMYGWQWLDPVISLIIVAAIVWGTWDLLRESLDLATDAVPRSIDPGAVSAWLGALPGVTRIHDLHIWAMSTTENALTVHLVMPDGGDDHFLHELTEGLEDRFGIGHSTVQVERQDAGDGCGRGAA
ncbi:MAG: cation transporter [Gammaproteobacteria bacterium]|nr:cation transporter [Gammaproteobacteria bacterium]